jgi:hypothetical protein
MYIPATYKSIHTGAIFLVGQMHLQVNMMLQTISYLRSTVSPRGGWGLGVVMGRATKHRRI